MMRWIVYLVMFTVTFIVFLFGDIKAAGGTGELLTAPVLMAATASSLVWPVFWFVILCVTTAKILANLEKRLNQKREKLSQDLKYYDGGGGSR